MKHYLQVTSNNGIFGTIWVGYVIEQGVAYPLAGFDTLSRAHDWALSEGFAGYVIGSPSVPWAKGCHSKVILT
jgi:hypothetical protein